MEVIYWTKNVHFIFNFSDEITKSNSFFYSPVVKWFNPEKNGIKLKIWHTVPECYLESPKKKPRESDMGKPNF